MSSSRQSRTTAAAPAAAAKPAPPTDALDLPLPPVTLDFAIRGEVQREGLFQRYVRKGDWKDATTAVIGKGGFGMAYRFVRDDSFTPPASMMDATFSSADGDITGGSELARKASKSQGTATGTGEGDVTSATSSPMLRSLTALPSHLRNVQSNPSAHSSPPKGQRNKAPAVVVVKVCRTPTSGSYDELPKTGIGRTEAKVAAQEIASGHPVGEHTRIVRGEARLLRFLQMCQTVKHIKCHQSHVVRLLADMPMPKMGEDGSTSSDYDEGYDGPPVARLLVFERLVDLDAELTPRGWAKSKDLWPIEKVEQVSKDAMAGLKFLHAHGIAHGDLKPSNFMRDARTGSVKLIDLGASRRWVRLHNMAKERTTAVEELDTAVLNGHLDPQKSEHLLCEGLGSLTGSPHFMAPEVLLQAGRYLSADGLARNVLDDYLVNKSQLPKHPSVALLNLAHRDFKRGWGIKADIWSWGCSVLSLLLRTIPSDVRPSSNTVCAFDFSFESTVNALTPLWPLHSSNDTLPRFHQWARIYALRIMAVVEKGVVVADYSSVLSPPYMQMLRASFYHQDGRPTAAMVLDYLDSHTSHNVEYMSELEPARAPSRAKSVAHSVTSVSSMGLSLPDEPHNTDLSVSSSVNNLRGASGNFDPRINTSEHNSALLPTNGALRGASTAAAAAASQQLAAKGSPGDASIRLTSHLPSPPNPSLALAPAAQSTLRAPSPLGFEASAAANARRQQGSNASSVHSTYASGGEAENETGANHERQHSGSPMTSVNTALSTPIMDQSAIPHVHRGQSSGGAEGRLFAETVANSFASSKSQNPERYSGSPQHKNSERRGSIFSRMALSLKLREATSPSASDAHQVPQMEYLDDRVSDEHAESDANRLLHPRASEDVNMHDRSTRNSPVRKTSAYNLLGLDLSSAYRSPLRTVRSLASMRSSSVPPSPSESRVFSMHRHAAPATPRASSGGHTLTEASSSQVTPFPLINSDEKPSAANTDDANSKPLQRKISTLQRVSASNHARVASLSQSIQAGASGAHPQPPPSPRTAEQARMSASTTSFLRVDPYGTHVGAGAGGNKSDDRDVWANQPTSASSTIKQQQQQPYNPVNQQRRLRSWSSIFRRNSRKPPPQAQ